MSLKDAPAHVQLAVDLIELLELNEVKPDLALAALAIVTRDYERKRAELETGSNPADAKPQS